MEHLQTRRIQRTGGSCFVSLPAPWLHQHGLGVGDLVSLSLDEGRLVVAPANFVGGGRS